MDISKPLIKLRRKNKPSYTVSTPSLVAIDDMQVAYSSCVNDRLRKIRKENNLLFSISALKFTSFGFFVKYSQHP